MKRRDFIVLGATGACSAAMTDKAWALKYYPMPSDKKCAVLYCTWCGSSRDAALWISEGMDGIADVFDVREQPDLRGYEHLIIGGGIRYNVTSPEMQEYITQHKSDLKAKVRGLFAVCGNMGNPVGPEQTSLFIDNHLAKLCETSDALSRVFRGRITKSLMDSQTAQMMAAMEDYDNLSRSECMAFGSEILSKINRG